MSMMEIRPPSSVEEYRAACEMVERIYKEDNYLPADARMTHPLALLVAVLDGQIVGSAGIESGDQGLLPTEKSFTFNADELAGIPRARIFENRKIVTVSHAGALALKGLIAASIDYGRQAHDCEVWVMTMKPAFIVALKRWCHVRTEVVPNDFPSPEVAAQHPGYFADPPFPLAVTADRTSTDAALERLFRDLEGKATLDVSRFNHYLDYGKPETYLVTVQK